MVFLTSLILTFYAAVAGTHPMHAAVTRSSRLLQSSQEQIADIAFHILGEDEEMVSILGDDTSSGRQGLGSEPQMERGRTLQFLEEPTERDQYMMEIVNRARLDPQGEADRYLDGDLNEGLPPGYISTEPKQPLAWHLNIQKAAKEHGMWMLETGVQSHGGAGGSGPLDRMEAAGYRWRGTVHYGENIGWDGTNGEPDYELYVRRINKWLFQDFPIPSRGHRLDMMRGSFREAGISTPLGAFRNGRTIFQNSMMVVQDFAVPVNAQYTVTFSGDLKNDGSTVDASFQVSVGEKNVKQDVVSDQLPGGPSVGTWGSWSGWALCNADCEGTQTRTRTCIGNGCVGLSTETRNCGGACSSPGTWGPWSAWSSCSATCGSSLQTKTRSCVGSGCVGPMTETQQCNLDDCPTAPGESFKLPISSYTGFEFYDNSWGYLSQCFDGVYGEGRRQKGHVCHSEEMADPWIEITLPQVYTISSIKIWNRWSCCQGRLGLHEWYVDGQLCHSSVADPAFEIEDDCGLQGSKIRLKLPGPNRVINLQEIEIFGSSAAGPIGTSAAPTSLPDEPLADPTFTPTAPPTLEPTEAEETFECSWVPVPRSECPSLSQSRRMADCHEGMASGDLCEADTPLPDGSGPHNIDNCPGGYDVFRYACSGTEIVDEVSESTFEFMGDGLCRSSQNVGVRGMAHLQKSDEQCRQECERSDICVGYSAKKTASGICYVYGQFGHNLPPGWSGASGWANEVGMGNGVPSMRCFKRT